MPFPDKYKELGVRFLPLQRSFFIMAAIGLAVSVLSIFISIQFRLNLLLLHGMGFLMFLWGWGLFLMIHWYGKTHKRAKKLPPALISFSQWFSSFFLNIWFLFGTIGIMMFTFY